MHQVYPCLTWRICYKKIWWVSSCSGHFPAVTNDSFPSHQGMAWFLFALLSITSFSHIVCLSKSQNHPNLIAQMSHYCFLLMFFLLIMWRGEAQNCVAVFFSNKRKNHRNIETSPHNVRLFLHPAIFMVEKNHDCLHEMATTRVIPPASQPSPISIIYSGWWFGCHVLFSHEYWVSVIIPIDFHSIIFQVGVAFKPPTSQSCSIAIHIISYLLMVGKAIPFWMIAPPPVSPDL